jgi:hypothetical protein
MYTYKSNKDGVEILEKDPLFDETRVILTGPFSKDNVARGIFRNLKRNGGFAGVTPAFFLTPVFTI